MSHLLIALTGLAYAFVCWDQARKGNLNMAMVYGGYAFSNIGLYMAAR